MITILWKLYGYKYLWNWLMCYDTSKKIIFLKAIRFILPKYIFFEKYIDVL